MLQFFILFFQRTLKLAQNNIILLGVTKQKKAWSGFPLYLFNENVKKDVVSILNAVCKNTKIVKDTIYLINKKYVKMRLF